MYSDYRIKINGLYLEGFNEQDSKLCFTKGWTSYQKGVISIPILSTKKEKALLIGGVINLQSYLDRICKYFRSIDKDPLAIKKITIEVLDKELI